jgi:hypothetical protein
VKVKWTWNVAHLRDKQRIAGELEHLLPMRLQAERTPDARDRRLRQACVARHAAPAPVRRIGRHALQRLGDRRIDACVVDRARRPRPRRIQESIEPVLDKACSPVLSPSRAGSETRVVQVHAARCQEQPAQGLDVVKGAACCRRECRRKISRCRPESGRGGQPLNSTRQ